MQSSKVVLISPPPYLTSGKHASLSGSEHLGLGYLASALEAHGIVVDILILEETFMEPEEARDYILSSTPIYIGVSPTSYSMEWTSAFCRAVKEVSSTPILAGGHLATHMGDKFLELNPDIDFVCRGDGEETLCKLVEQLQRKQGEYEQIANLIFRDSSNEIHKSLSIISTECLDNLDWPKHQLLGRKSARIVTSRGCKYNCDFCTTPSFYGRKVRYRSITDVVNEIHHLHETKGVNKFFFSDDSFVDNSTFSIERVNSFVEALKASALNIEFRCEIRADVIARNIDLIHLLYSVGMNYLFVGFESCLESDISTYNKGLDIDDINKVPALLKNIGISVVPGFIMYNEHSRIDDLTKKVEFLRKNDYLYRTTYFARTCMGYPGSKMYEEMIACNRFDKNRSTDYLLYPEFQCEHIRLFSLAFQEIEMLYLDLDHLMLNAVIYNYDNFQLRREIVCKCIEPKLKQAANIFSQIQDKYLSMYNYSIDIAKNNGGNFSQHIIDFFRQEHSYLEKLVNQFVTLVNMPR
ncbi:MAG: B12-binding domain-containing radical SAM protein [Suipraeoptans sp.]